MSDTGNNIGKNTGNGTENGTVGEQGPGSESERLQELLCAYVLGECDEAGRAEIERALAASDALRAERDRLAATIGLVKNAMGRDETLSWRATSEVAREAERIHAGPPPQVAWHRTSSFRAAASFVVLIGGALLGWRAFVYSSRLDATVETAKAPTGSLTAGAKSAPAESTSLGFGLPATEDAQEPAAGKPEDLFTTLGYSGGTGGNASPEALEQLKRAVEKESMDQRLRGLNDGVRTAGAPSKQLRVNDAATPPGDSAGMPDFDTQVAQFQAQADPNVSLALEPKQARGEIESLFVGRIEQQPAAGGPPSSGAGPGGDIFDKGRFDAPGQASRPTGPSTPPPGTPGLSAGLAGGGGGPALAATNPAPTAPVAETKAKGAAKAEEAKNLPDAGGAPSSGSDEYYLGRGRAEEELALRVHLGTLGYGADAALEEAEQDLPEVRQTAGGELTDFERVDRFADKDASRDAAHDDGEEVRKQRRLLTPEERRQRAEMIVASCRRLPDERPRDMFFRFWGDNPFEWTANDRLSTFAMDVDTASYTLARRYLVENHLPEKAQIRTEEFVNYFKPDVAPPAKDAGTFAIATELAPSRYSDPRENKWMLRVAVRGMEIAQNERLPLALTLVVDVSGSMRKQNRLELVKHAMRLLVSQLDPRDSISIVTFSGDARLVLPMTSVGKRALIESAIDPLQPDQSTNTEAGLRMGYEQALANLAKNTIHRVVLLTDGVANVGITDPNALVQTVERQRKAGIYLNTIGVGMNNHNDNLLEQLADKGDGVCNYVDDAAEVKKVLVDDLLKTLVPIARDAKVQVEFDPAQVESYRLLGYENRAVADQDFRNDKVDAGEINSGHQITALYELVRTGRTGDAPLAKVNLRFKPPHKDGVASAASEEASEIAKPVFARDAAASFEQTSFGYRRAVLAGQFAEFLRRSVHARGDSLDQLIVDAQKLAAEKHDAETSEFCDMVTKSRALLDAEFARRGRIDQAVHDLRRSCYDQARLQARRLESDKAELARLEREIAEREIELRKLLDPPMVR